MIEIVLIGNIARCGRSALEQNLAVPHHLREYPCALGDAEVLVGSPVSSDMIGRTQASLRLVHSAGAGYDAIVVDALPEDVPLCLTFHHERAMTEYVLMAMLALDRDLMGRDRALRHGVWEGSCVTGPPRARELAGRTLGILGYGHIGREIARVAAALDLEVLPLGSRHTREQFERVLAASDYLVIACPLNDETRGLIGAGELRLMKPDAALINVARGEIVDEESLFHALQRRRIRAAALDVWYRYPMPGETCLPSAFPFHTLDNVLMSPHCSGWTDRVLELRFAEIAANIVRLVRGEPLHNVVPRATACS